MNNIFSINRFGKTIKYDLVNYFPRFYTGIFILIAIMPVNLVIKIITSDSPVSFYVRMSMLMAFLAILMFFAPFVIYKNVNNAKSGIDYTLLPASGLEKFLSMFLICSIILPIILICSYLLTDVIMATIPNKWYQEYIPLNAIFSFSFLRTIIIAILIQSLALCGNMIFKKAKIGKTILAAITFIIILGAVITKFSSNPDRYKFISVPQDSTGLAISEDSVGDIIHTSVDNDTVIANDNNIIIKTKEGEQVIIDAEKIKQSKNKDGVATDVVFIKDGKKYDMKDDTNTAILKKGLHDIILFIKIACFLLCASMYFLTFWRIKKQQI